MNYLAIGIFSITILGAIGGLVLTLKGDKDLGKVKTELANVKDYSVYAMMNIFGTDRMIFGGNGLTVTASGSDLYDRMTKIVTLNPDNKSANVKKEAIGIKESDAVIQKYPNFPWGYYVKAIIQQANGVPQWRETAILGVNVFKITTSIRGHAPSQDDGMLELESLITAAQ